MATARLHSGDAGGGSALAAAEHVAALAQLPNDDKPFLHCFCICERRLHLFEALQMIMVL